MKCKVCGYWNRIEVNKLFIEYPSSEPKVKAIIPMYEPLKTETCKKCKTIIDEPKELRKKKEILRPKRCVVCESV